MTPRLAPAARGLGLALVLVQSVACARATRAPEDGPETPGGPVADVAAAYTCAADAALALGYALPEAVTERARSGQNRGGGSFVAERRVPSGGGRNIVGTLGVSIRVARASGSGGSPSGTLHVRPSRFEEWGADAAPPTTTAPRTPRIRPAGAIGGTTERPRRSRGRRQYLPVAEEGEHALAIVSRCAG